MISYDCGNCKHHWYEKSYLGFETSKCPSCGSYYIMTTQEWSEEDAIEEAKFGDER